MAVTPENYKFKYKGRGQLDGRDVYIFQVTPRQKRQGLFQGEVWIDAATYLRVQESGYLVKNPSIFLKKVAFVRKYEIRDGISVPRQVAKRGGHPAGRPGGTDHRLTAIFRSMAQQGVAADTDGQ